MRERALGCGGAAQGGEAAGVGQEVEQGEERGAGLLDAADPPERPPGGSGRGTLSDGQALREPLARAARGGALRLRLRLRYSLAEVLQDRPPRRDARGCVGVHSRVEALLGAAPARARSQRRQHPRRVLLRRRWTPLRARGGSALELGVTVPGAAVDHSGVAHE